MNLLDTLKRDKKSLWVDAWDYGKRLLLKNQEPPWNNVAATINHFKKLQSLLNSDVIMIPLEAFYRQYLANNPALVVAMGEKRRVGFPLKTMLADEIARTQLIEVTQAMAASFSDLPVVLQIPSPKRWLANLASLVRGAPVEIDEKDMETASIYVADFLRLFSHCQISGLVMQEDDEGGGNHAEIQYYQPVINVCRNYRWPVGIRGQHPLPVREAILDFAITPAGNTLGLVSAAVLDETFWRDKSVSNGDFYFIEIPADQKPEMVLESIRFLRG